MTAPSLSAVVDVLGLAVWSFAVALDRGGADRLS
jgi:hypothetical protein